MVAQAAPTWDRGTVTYWPRGAARALFTDRSPELLIEGPAGTGKSFACLWKVHLAALKYPGMHGLIVRKTLVSLTGSALVTFAERVVGAGEFGVMPFGGSKLRPTAFRYPNGSEIIVGGLDKASKIMSSEYDVIYANEATELSESDWESLTSRLRYGVMPYQQLLADCNPDAPSHWLNHRCEAGRTLRLRSRHEDNPALWDADAGQWTDKGADYIARLDALSGVRYQRLRLGKWVAAEGTVYEFDRAVHILPDLPFKPKRYLAGVDWGYTHPGTMLVAALDGDGRAVIVDELYMTGKTIDWWIAKAKQRHDRYQLETIVCDPSQPGYIDQFQQAGLPAHPAVNDIAPGIDAVQQRLRPDGTGMPRLAFLADCLSEPDERLRDDKRPLSTIDEFDLYVWAKRPDGSIRDLPKDEHNHGLDSARYICLHLDQGGAGFERVPEELTFALASLGV